MVDGGGSHRCALLGDNIAEMGYKNGWSVSHPSLPHLSHSCDTLCSAVVVLVARDSTCQRRSWLLWPASAAITENAAERVLLSIASCSLKLGPSRLTSACLAQRLFAVQGIIINGCIRDSDDISRMPLGVKALNTYPLKSSKRDNGLSQVPVTIAGAIVSPGDWIYADKDGVLVSSTELTGK